MKKSSESSSAFNAILTNLRTQYQANLYPTLNEMNRQVLSLDPNVGQATLQGLHNELHKLAGSGATFGLPELSKQARLLEHTAKQWLDANQAIEPEQWQHWVSAILGLRLLIQPVQKQALAASQLPQRLSFWPSPHGNNIVLIQEKNAAAALLQELANFGYQISHFPDFNAAMLALQSTPPDLLLIASNGTDKQALLQDMQQWFIQLEWHIPVIFITPNVEFASYLAAAKARVDCCITQPVNIPQLINHIECLLRTHETPARIMLMDDDKALARHYSKVLENAGLQVRNVSNPRNILSELDQFNPDVLLLDVDMPNISGDEIARLIRYHERWNGLTIIYLSGSVGVMQQLQVMQSGADEFLIKPIADVQLIVTLFSRVLRARHLASLITHDGLTRLLNHNSIMQRLVQECDRAKRSHEPMCVAIIDIDFFKHVNDSWGHPVGDEVLKALSHLMRHRLRRQDSIGRCGGEEFLLLLPECTIVDAQRLLDDLRQHFASLVFKAGHADFQVTISAGIASSDSFADNAQLLAAADQALYHAKHSGRNQVCSNPAIPTT